VVGLRLRGWVVLWPVYFDAGRSRGEGRRVPRRLAVPSPSVEALVRAVEALGLRYRVVRGAAHPRIPWRKTGMVIVERVKPKGEIVRDVARFLKSRGG